MIPTKFCELTNQELKDKLSKMTAKSEDGKVCLMIKKETLESNGGCCPVCGLPCRIDEITIHHILPVHRFPELKDDKRNITAMCWRCHKVIHRNPFRNAELMLAKAEELDVDIKEIYHIERKQQ